MVYFLFYKTADAVCGAVRVLITHGDENWLKGLLINFSLGSQQSLDAISHGLVSPEPGPQYY